MKKDWKHLEGWRVRRGDSKTDTGDDYGKFVVLLESGVTLAIIAVSGAPGSEEMESWDHVSVHARQPTLAGKIKVRTPTWDEMCEAKNLFWDPEECVVQYHPAASDYVNVHPHVLHLWKPVHVAMPTPPMLCV